MVTIKNIAGTHILALDTNTDKSHLFSVDDKKNPILTFDSSGTYTDTKKRFVCNLTIDINKNWITKNSLGIVTDPVSMNKTEGIFDVEAQFCKKWLEMKTVKVN